jgi:hypothetical protein
MPDPRWFQIMTNLLYPAVLGTLIYTFAQHSLASASLSDPMFMGGLALLALFVMDYAHSLRDEVRTTYDGRKFLADFIVVVGLFLAGTAILNQPVFPTVAYVWWLFMAKAAAVAWNVRRQRINRRRRRRPVACCSVWRPTWHCSSSTSCWPSSP